MGINIYPNNISQTGIYLERVFWKRVIDKRVSDGVPEITWSELLVSVGDFQSWKYTCVFANKSIGTERVSR